MEPCGNCPDDYVSPGGQELGREANSNVSCVQILVNEASPMDVHVPKPQTDILECTHHRREPSFAGHEDLPAAQSSVWYLDRHVALLAAGNLGPVPADG